MRLGKDRIVRDCQLIAARLPARRSLYFAKDKWGLISDTALREPVTITRHGRPSLVVTSIQDYQALQRLKYSRLQADIEEGVGDLEQGRFSTKSVDDLIAEGKERGRRS
jgi:prevent-host-death family protein